MGKIKLSAKKVSVILAVFCCCLAIYALGVQSDYSKLQEENASYAASIQTLNGTLESQEGNYQQVASLEKQVNDLQYELKLKLQEVNDLQYELKLRQETIDKMQATPKQTNSSTQSSASASTTKSQTVYITETGSKYHRDGCQYLSKSQIAISLTDAKSQGYSACSKCW